MLFDVAADGRAPSRATPVRVVGVEEVSRRRRELVGLYVQEIAMFHFDVTFKIFLGLVATRTARHRARVGLVCARAPRRGDRVGESHDVLVVARRVDLEVALKSAKKSGKNRVQDAQGGETGESGDLGISPALIFPYGVKTTSYL